MLLEKYGNNGHTNDRNLSSASWFRIKMDLLTWIKKNQWLISIIPTNKFYNGTTVLPGKYYSIDFIVITKYVHYSVYTSP